MAGRLFIGIVAAGFSALMAAATVGAMAADAKTTMVVVFSIKDYESWRPVFDGAAPQREKIGVTNGRIYRSADKPNDLLVLFDVSSTANGEKWMTSAEVRADWEKGGVVGTPKFYFVR